MAKVENSLEYFDDITRITTKDALFVVYGGTNNVGEGSLRKLMQEITEKLIGFRIIKEDQKCLGYFQDIAPVSLLRAELQV